MTVRRDQRTFVDTSGYYAVVDRDDQSHLQASEVFRSLTDERRRFLTTNFVVAELHALVLARISARVAYAVLADVRASHTVVRVRIQDERRADEILARYDDQEFSLTDALSFAVMERLGIREVFSLDHHFAQFGWLVVPS